MTLDERDAFKTAITRNPDELLLIMKNLKAYEWSYFNNCFSKMFEYLNIHHQRTHQHCLGLGRYLTDHLDSTLIFILTGSASCNSPTDITGLDKPALPGISSPGAIEYMQPFRWHHRVFVIALDSQLKMMPPTFNFFRYLSDDTNGAFYRVKNVKELRSCAASLTCRKPANSKEKNIVIDHVKFPPVAPVSVLTMLVRSQANHTEYKKLRIYVPEGTSDAFPIPEEFWPQENPDLMRRKCTPTILVTNATTTFTLPQNFPFVSVMIDSNSEAITSLKRESNFNPKKRQCWFVKMPGSGEPKFSSTLDVSRSHDQPFGYIEYEKTPDKRDFKLIILPYNFKMLFKLMKRFPTSDYARWSDDFTSYMNSIPCYYWRPIYTALSSYTGMEDAWPKSLKFPSLLLEMERNAEATSNKAAEAFVRMNNNIIEAAADRANQKENIMYSNKRVVESPNALSVNQSVEQLLTVKQAFFGPSTTALNKILRVGGSMRTGTKKYKLSQEELDKVHSVSPEIMMDHSSREPYIPRPARIPKEEFELWKSRLGNSQYPKNIQKRPELQKKIGYSASNSTSASDVAVTVRQSEEADEAEKLHKEERVLCSITQLLYNTKDRQMRPDRYQYRKHSATRSIHQLKNRIPKSTSVFENPVLLIPSVDMIQWEKRGEYMEKLNSFRHKVHDVPMLNVEDEPTVGGTIRSPRIKTSKGVVVAQKDAVSLDANSMDVDTAADDAGEQQGLYGNDTDGPDVDGDVTMELIPDTEQDIEESVPEQQVFDEEDSDEEERAIRNTSNYEPISPRKSIPPSEAQPQFSLDIESLEYPQDGGSSTFTATQMFPTSPASMYSDGRIDEYDVTEDSVRDANQRHHATPPLQENEREYPKPTTDVNAIEVIEIVDDYEEEVEREADKMDLPNWPDMRLLIHRSIACHSIHFNLQKLKSIVDTIANDKVTERQEKMNRLVYVKKKAESFRRVDASDYAKVVLNSLTKY